MELIKHALSVRSDHSLGESIMQVGTVVEKAKELGYKSVALVDTMTISGMVALSSACKKAGIKPIVGCTVRVYDDPTYRKPKKDSGEEEKENRWYQLKVYARSDKGLRSLMKLLTKGNSAAYFYYHSRVGLQDVLELEDVVVTTGDLFNVFHHPRYVNILDQLNETHPTFVEFVPINTPLFDTLNKRALDYTREYGRVSVASYPFFYGGADDADTLDVLRAITSNSKMEDMWLPIPYTRDWCFDEPKKLASRMMDLSKRIDMTREEVVDSLKWIEDLADYCKYEFVKLPPCLPKMADDEFLTLVERCKQGWKERFAMPVMGHSPEPSQLATEYKERLAYELSVLKKLGFANYFLVVQDIVNWSKENGVIVGPGRGSVGGSLIAYLMGITDVDPIRHNLLFERFINADRIDLPDADLDFMSSRRGEVIAYITNRYGAENVAGISNYSTLGPASAMRDTSRVHGLELFEYACSKQVEKEHGVSLSLEESAEKVPDIAKFKAGHPIIWKHATKLEGCMRNLGQHAAGVIVAGEPILNRAVLMNRKEGELPVVSWDKTIVEDWGLIKMDILGLSTLDVLNLAQHYIKERHGKRINFLRIPLDEPDVMASFGKGETVGCFQFEGAGMRKLLKDLACLSPLTFEDIAAATALYRPGPIDAGLVDQFIAVKQGKSLPKYDHPLMEPALRNTYGVITYQEQVMQVCRDLAGFTMVEADHVRKAMGKKDKEKMATYREKFIAGATKAGMSETDAGLLWDKIEGFAGYAFNKSHSVEYSIISYWCQWLKVRYTAEFFAAAMTIADKEEKLTALVLDARRLGIEVMPPDINKSSGRIEIEGERLLYAPFQAIKGISENVASHILAVRAAHARPFTSKAEFEAAVSLAKLGAKVNKSHREKLDRVGAFANIEPETRPAMHPERLKDRIELMPGFTVDAVKADRTINDERLAKLEILKLAGECRDCDKCSLKGCEHPVPRLGRRPKFMVVFDCPSWKEARSGKMLDGDIANYMKAGFSEVGLDFNDGYFTALVKAPKDKDAKGLTMEQINGCSGYLAREIDILKPPVIVAMGSNAIRYFAPGTKGSPAELAGKVIFRPDLDASVIFGLNPQTIFFDPSKIKLLQEVCLKISELVS